MRAPARPVSLPFRPTATGPVKPVAPELRLGSTGTAVVELQKRLLSLGFWLVAPSGVFDDSTEQAVFAAPEGGRNSERWGCRSQDRSGAQ